MSRVPWPDTIRHDAEVATGRGVFEVGESVWVEGWPKSKNATYRVHRIVVRDTAPVDVQVAYDHRGTRQIHSVQVDRLNKRRDRR